MMPVLSEVDANGQVFRTDLRLRPDGDAGPLAWSLDALEHYLIGQGREWERYAWLRPGSCPPAPSRQRQRPAGAAAGKPARALRVPQVFRLRRAGRAARCASIRQDWQRRASAQRHRQRQQHQAGRRRHPRDRIRGPAGPADPRRTHAGPAAPPARSARRKRRRLLPEADAQRLEAAYRFLRRTEHALQYREDEQTPAARRPALRAALAAALGMRPARGHAGRAPRLRLADFPQRVPPGRHGRRREPRRPPMRPTRKNPTNSASWPDRSVRPSATRPTTCCARR